MINDTFYKTGFEITRIPYEVLYGLRTLKQEYKDIQSWFKENYQICIKYIHKGKIINVEHGHYLEGINLYIKKDIILNDIGQIKHDLNTYFKFSGIDTAEHKEWGITPEDSISFIILEDALKTNVDNFIYNMMKNKVLQFGAHLEFTSFDLAQRYKENYEYRICYLNENELEKHNNNKDNSKIAKEFDMLIFNNNYMGIYNDLSPKLKFIVRKA